jgi:hypothetical protein
MEKNTATFRNTSMSKVLFGLGIFTSMYWLAGLFGVYDSDTGSAVFEMLWIFMVLLILAIPLLSLLRVVKEKSTSFRSLNLLTLIITLTTLLLLMTIRK